MSSIKSISDICDLLFKQIMFSKYFLLCLGIKNVNDHSELIAIKLSGIAVRDRAINNLYMPFINAYNREFISLSSIDAEDVTLVWIESNRSESGSGFIQSSNVSMTDVNLSLFLNPNDTVNLHWVVTKYAI